MIQNCDARILSVNAMREVMCCLHPSSGILWIRDTNMKVLLEKGMGLGVSS